MVFSILFYLITVVISWRQMLKEILNDFMVLTWEIYGVLLLLYLEIFFSFY